MASWIRVGIFPVIDFFILIFAIIDLNIGNRFDNYMIAFIGGTIAVGAAYFAVQAVRTQVNQGYAAEEDRRIRSLRAAAAMLPMALLRIGTACEKNIQRNFVCADLFSSPPQVDDLQTVPDDVFHVLRECIEFSDEISHQSISYFIRGYQVMIARGDNLLAAKPLIEANKEDYMRDFDRMNDAISWASLHSFVGNMFWFARGEETSIRQWLPSGTRDSLLAAGVDFDEFTILGQRYEERLDSNQLVFRFFPK